MRVTYTAILGGFPNELKRPPETTTEQKGCDFTAFVDNLAVPEVAFGVSRMNGWDLKVIHPDGDPRRKARLIKTLAHRNFPDAEYSLWLDGCLTLLTPYWLFVDRFLSEHDICVFEHMQRSCVYRELEACIRLNKDEPKVMRDQVNRYRREGYPYNNGLGETTAVLRRHTPKIAELNELWWEEIQRGSLRDQLSFDYCCWKLGIEYATFEGTRTNSPHFKHTPHR